MTYTNIFSLLKTKLFGTKKEENIIFYNSVTVKNYNNNKKHKHYFRSSYCNSYDDYINLPNNYYSEIGLSLNLRRSLSLITNESKYSNDNNYDNNDNYDSNDNNYNDNYDDIINQIIQLY